MELQQAVDWNSTNIILGVPKVSPGGLLVLQWFLDGKSSIWQVPNVITIQSFDVPTSWRPKAEFKLVIKVYTADAGPFDYAENYVAEIFGWDIFINKRTRDMNPHALALHNALRVATAGYQVIDDGQNELWIKMPSRQ